MIKVGICGVNRRLFDKLDIIEIQNTFYSLPNFEYLKKLKRESPKNLEFSFKSFQGITHDIKSPTWKRSGLKKEELERLKDKVGNLRPTKEVLEYFELMKEVYKILDAKFIVIQTPNSFIDSEENMKNAYEFFSTIDKNLNIAIEFRGWKKENIIKIAREFNLTIITDPNLDIIEQKINYFRIHGKYEGKKIIYNYSFSDIELKNLYEKIKNLDSYVLFNNYTMYKDSLKFKELIK